MRRVLPAVFTTLLTACPDRAPPPNPVLDLTRPATAVAPRLRLTPTELATHADFDRLERTILDRQAPEALVAALELLAAQARPAERPADALLLARLAMLHRDYESNREGWLQKAIDGATRLSKEAPDAPDTLFLQGYIPFAYLGGSDTRDAVVDPSDPRVRQFVEACVQQWKKLVAAQPSWKGPRAFTAARISQIVATLESALAPPPGDVAAQAEPRPLAREELLAVGELERFASSTDGQRRTLCRDWGASRKGSTGEATSPVLRLDLACALFERRVPEAVALVDKVATLDGPAFDPCMPLLQVVDFAGREPVLQALGTSSFKTRCGLAQ